MPFIHKQVKFEEDNVIFPDETFEYIIENINTISCAYLIILIFSFSIIF